MVLLLCFLHLSLGGCNFSLKQCKFCIQIRHCVHSGAVCVCQFGIGKDGDALHNVAVLCGA